MLKELFSSSLLCGFLISQAYAADSLRVSGFGNLGAVYTDSEYYRFRTDISRGGDTDNNGLDLNAINTLGLQLDYHLNNQVDLVGQLTYRGQDNISLDNSVGLAFLRYKATPNWHVRIGRTPLDLYLLTEYRDISFAYPWAKVPNEVYGLIPYRTLDGGDITYQNFFESIDYRIKLFTGRAESDIAFTTSADSLEIHKLLGLSLELSQLHWTVSLKHTQTTIKNNISALADLLDNIEQIPDPVWANKHSFINDFSLENKKAAYSSAGIRYDFEKVTLMAELAHLSSDSDVVGNINSGYVNATYHLGKSQFFYSYARTHSTKYTFNEPTLMVQFLPMDITPLLHAIEEAPSAFASNQFTHSIGWRYDLKDNIALKAQLDHTDIRQGGSALWLYDGLTTASPSESFNSLFISMSFTF